jgi:hypothetical protein
MAKQPDQDRKPTAPTPTADTPLDGTTQGRALAKQYLPDTVRLLAAIALGRDSEAPMHTRMLAAKAIIDVAGVTPPTPTAPSHDGALNGNEA